MGITDFLLIELTDQIIITIDELLDTYRKLCALLSSSKKPCPQNT